MRRFRRDTVVWLCLLISLVAGLARMRSAEGQGQPGIVADGPWKNLPWSTKARFRPIQVSVGPLLFIRSEDHRLRLVDPERSKMVQDLGPLGDFDSVIDRLDADHALIESDGLAVWQMSSGRIYTVPGDQFVTLDKDDGYFFETNKVLSGRLGKVTPHGWQWLSSQPFDKVIGQTDSSLLATAKGQLFEVDKQGNGVRRLTALPYTSHLDADLSPDRSKIAIGCCAGSEATLLVLDLNTGQVVGRRDNMMLPVVGNDFPHLYCAWLDASRVRYLARSGKDFCFRDLDLNTGFELGIGPAIEGNRAGYPDPRPDLTGLDGAFCVREGKLYCRERDLGPVYGFERFAIEPRGRWAASTGQGQLRVWDATGSASPLGPRPFHVGWLPAVGPLAPVTVYGLGDFYQRTHRYRFTPREPNAGA